MHHLIRVPEDAGQSAASEVVYKLGGTAEIVYDLCHRICSLCERGKRSAEAQAYNTLVQSWPEIVRWSRTEVTPQDMLFDGEAECLPM